MRTTTNSNGLSESIPSPKQATMRVTAFWGAIFRFMQRQGLEHHDAEDCTQSFFLKIARHGLAERWDQEAVSDLHLQNLVFRCAGTHCIDEYRRSHRQRRSGSVMHLSVEASEGLPELVCAQPAPDTAAELAELKQQMQDAVEEMGQRHAARGRAAQFTVAMPHLLDEGGGVSQRDAAKALALRENAFRALLFRLRRELAGELRDRAA